MELNQTLIKVMNALSELGEVLQNSSEEQINKFSAAYTLDCNIDELRSKFEDIREVFL